MNSDSLRYAGFGPRLASILLDCLIMSPLIALIFWAKSHYRLFDVYYLIPDILFGLFYSVYLVKRFGGTPGKLIMGIRIRKLNGEPVTYREATLRYFPDFLFGLLLNIASIAPLIHMSDAEYFSLSRIERYHRISELAPSWHQTVHVLSQLWYWSELIVLLTNKKRRALHDFIAGTVVVHVSPSPGADPLAAVPPVLSGT